LNAAWVNFANDVPNPDIATFTTIFQNTFAAGGRVVRWWLHVNGTVTPGYQSNGMVQDIPQSHITGVEAILSAAAAAHVAVNISLWSFDMLQGTNESIPAATTTNNTNLLTVNANRQSYITNYLTPLVTALKGNPGLYSYEIFNEPEGMMTGVTGGSFAQNTIAPSFIQTTVNQFASAIHEADPNALVTNGAQTFNTCSNAGGMENLYSNEALSAAGGKSDGTLDFYEVHYYTSNGTGVSCFTHDASTWQLDKNIVMGEFYALATGSVAADAIYTTIFNNGYNGAWAWEYTSSSGNAAGSAWPSMQTPMMDLFTAETSTVGGCP
jgi:hypothetical protein